MGVCTICRETFTRLRSSTHCNNCYNQHQQQQQNEEQQEPEVPAAAPAAGGIAPAETVANTLNEITVDGNKRVNELNVNELVALINTAILPVTQNVATIKKEFEKKTKSYDNKILLLEADTKKKQDRIDALESTIVEMQKFINKLDHDDRKTNIIVTGLSEESINAPAGNEDVVDALNNDTDKIRVLIDSIDNDENFDISTWDISRIGRVREGYTRAVKIVTTSTEERDKVLSLAPRLKSQPAWSKVYVKKDLHPVYAKENQRIRKKRYDLATHYANNNEQKEVKLVNGAIQVDGVTVDRNMFFR